ncbi:MAG: C_GCAxxG_C_C family protein [Clostridia bacterium]|nr:C_GCAxxG_C_C family protein [Clostridia bacterium]
MDRVEKAEELFKSGYNCSQSVIGAFCDDLGLDFDTTMKLSEGFGGGIGRMRLTCGAVSGMVMVTGMMLSRGEKDGDARAKVYSKVQELAAKFKEMNGSTVCADLLGLNKSGETNPNPEARTAEYYQKRPCVDLVKDAVRIIEEEFEI